jgi:hypothetical protein
LSRDGTDDRSVTEFASKVRVAMIGWVSFQDSPKQPALPLVKLDSFGVVHVSVSQVHYLKKSVCVRLEVVG